MQGGKEEGEREEGSSWDKARLSLLERGEKGRGDSSDKGGGRGRRRGEPLLVVHSFWHRRRGG